MTLEKMTQCLPEFFEDTLPRVLRAVLHQLLIVIDFQTMTRQRIPQEGALPGPLDHRVAPLCLTVQIQLQTQARELNPGPVRCDPLLDDAMKRCVARLSGTLTSIGRCRS